MANELEIFETPRFKRELRDFDKPLRSRILNAINKLRSRPWHNALRVKKVEAYWSCRVALSIRMIFEWVPKSEQLTLLSVGHRENFYRGFRYLSVNLFTGMESEEEFDDISILEKMMFTDHEYSDSAVIEGIVGAIVSAHPELHNTSHSLFELIPAYLRGGTEGKAKPTDGQGMASYINVIPSDSEGPCQDILVAFCFDNDNFDDRMRETAYHAGIHCPDTKAVVIVTSQWDPKKWSKHVDAFERLNATVFVYLAGFGGLTRIG